MIENWGIDVHVRSSIYVWIIEVVRPKYLKTLNGFYYVESASNLMCFFEANTVVSVLPTLRIRTVKKW